MTTEEYLIAALKKRGMTVTTVESCTGGLVAAALTSVPGSSEVYHQGYVTYCDDAKHKLVGVRKKTLKKHTAVSKQTALEMAEGGAREAKADCCLSVTGYAGPDTDGKEPVGLVYIGCFVKGRKTKAKKFLFQGNRQEIRKKASQQALLLLKSRLDQ